VFAALVVIILGIYLLSMHEEDELSSYACVASGQFGSLMPLSPPHRQSTLTHSFLGSSYGSSIVRDEKKCESVTESSA